MNTNMRTHGQFNNIWSEKLSVGPEGLILTTGTVIPVRMKGTDYKERSLKIMNGSLSGNSRTPVVHCDAFTYR